MPPRRAVPRQCPPTRPRSCRSTRRSRRSSSACPVRPPRQPRTRAPRPTTQQRPGPRSRHGARARTTRHAARMVDPVAIPSSTRMTVLPAISRGGRPLRSRCTRRSSSTRSRCSILAISCCPTPTRPSTSSSTTRTPPSPIAPRAYSGWEGAPSLRTTITRKSTPPDISPIWHDRLTLDNCQRRARADLRCPMNRGD